ncbi:MAG: PEP-CTERM sorting domain-containing protein [Phycisphaerae bacterium]|jgi:hypothetical protein|nr:PEP-CTERM sorting domain-containing protein [Phycisphaerae bacterium]
MILLRRAFVLAAIAALVCPLAAQGSWTVTNLTNDPAKGQSEVRVSDGYIAWLEWDSSNSDANIYLYEVASDTSKVVTDDSYRYWPMRLSGPNVAWLAYDGASNVGDYYMYSGGFSGGSTAAVTTDWAIRSAGPEISGTTLIWSQDWYPEVYLYNGGVPQQISSAGGAVSRPVISGDYVAWGQYESVYQNGHVYQYHDGSASEISTETATNFRDIAISGSRVVWYDHDSSAGTHDIWYYDGTSAEKIFSHDDYIEELCIDGSTVAWYTDNDDGYTTIFLYDGTSVVDLLAPTTYGEIGAIDISGSLLVWDYTEGGGDEEGSLSVIMLYDGTSIQQISPEGDYCMYPRVSGDVIAWEVMDLNTYNSDIAMTVVPEPGSLALIAMGALALLRRRR